VRLRHHAFAGQYHGASRLDAETIARLTPERFFAGSWRRCSPERGRDLRRRLCFARRVAATTGVPVGLVNYAVGGAPIGVSSPPSALRREPDFGRKVAGDWLANESLDGSFVRLRARQHLAGATRAPQACARPEPWLQARLRLGRRPRPDHGLRASWASSGIRAKATRSAPWTSRNTRGSVKLLVADWREQWRDPGLPFLTCQLPAIAEPARLHWPRPRGPTPARGIDGTLRASRHPGSGRPKDVHPKEKREVGERLARWALFPLVRSR
jgi:sialate O-acetylesterase